MEGGLGNGSSREGPWASGVPGVDAGHGTFAMTEHIR